MDHHWLGHDSLFIPIRVKLTQELIGQLAHWVEWQAKEGEDKYLTISGLNLVQADPELKDHIELEVGID